MIANALLFTIVILLGYGFWLFDQLKFMARYKAFLHHARRRIQLARCTVQQVEAEVVIP